MFSCRKYSRLGLGPEEIDRRERAPGAATGMERMPSPPRARFSFCQPLPRPEPTPIERRVCVASYTLLWAASVAACLVAAGASGAADAETPPPILEGKEGEREGEGGERGIGTGGCGGNCATQPRARRDGQGRHACCEGTTAFAGTKGMSPHYLLEIRTDFSHFFCSFLSVRLSGGYYRGRG